jgi:lipopolysaccharide biosynthesis glycosyltransferase
MTASRPVPIVVACAANGAYALPLAVMLRSAAANLDPRYRLEVHAVDDGIGREDKERVVRSLPARVVVHWVAPRPLPEAALVTWGRMPATTYQRLSMEEWLPPGVEKAIWLDCDLIVLDDLARLWHEPLAGNVVLAVQDERVPVVSSWFGIGGFRDIGLAADTKYFNAGVLVIDVRRWRDDRVAARTLDYLASARERVFFWDQEGLNVALVGSWGALDERWNTNPIISQLLARRGDDVGRRSRRASIVHFTGNLKPWSYDNGSEHYARYYEFVDETAWAGMRPARGWRTAAIARYETSWMRRWLYPAEQWTTWLVKTMTQRPAERGERRQAPLASGR